MSSLYSEAGQAEQAGPVSDAGWHRRVDARGDACPMPLLKARQALADMRFGQRLLLLAADPGSRRDIPLFAAQCGYLLERIDEPEGYFAYTLLKPEAGAQ